MGAVGKDDRILVYLLKTCPCAKISYQPQCEGVDNMFKWRPAEISSQVVFCQALFSKLRDEKVLLLCKLYDVTDADLDTFLRGVYHENLRDGDMFLGLRLDVERRWLATLLAVQMLTQVASPALILSYARFLEDRKYFEDAFKIYERGIKVFSWPHVGDIWLTYLSKFVERYGGRKLERARDLFEQAVEKVPSKFARRLHMLYAKLEEEHGLARHALSIYNRATKAVEEKDMFEMYGILLRKTAELFGQTRTREIYDQAIEALPQDRIKDACMRYAKMETMLGEVDRARAIYVHASQFCDPRREEEFWKVWRGFEVQHGNEDTFRDMLRIKRSVQAMFSQVHFNATDIAAETGREVLDPMAAAEEEMKTEEERKRKGGALGIDAKRQRVTADAETARKELLGNFEPAEGFEGPRDGFIFKLGIKGLGYYEDSSLREIEARSAAAAAAERKALAAERKATEANPEEIELDLDDDEDEDAAPEAAPSGPAAPMASNAEEIELNVEDIDEAPIAPEVFGSGLSSLRASMPEVQIQIAKCRGRFGWVIRALAVGMRSPCKSRPLQSQLRRKRRDPEHWRNSRRRAKEKVARRASTSVTRTPNQRCLITLGRIE
ncbi:Pre-mRNA-splicing factor SYF1 [Symbiodinium microadriaticum]|uniref:Pre-mRNA-splicing factor SYF1 n=1 Tax=Symbiodinium microadriaticum TaxID=2951 RepID=A0A1Q9EQA3_SYMMI|nr:Pre-mRNA-splicing factor SYF1 [Symbiodinium microadriaticum]